MELAIPGAFGVSPTDNLKSYISHATLPELRVRAHAEGPDLQLIPDGHKSHKNHLSVDRGSWRRLEAIYSFLGDGLSYDLVRSFIESQVPDHPVTPEEGCNGFDEPFTMPCKGFHVGQLCVPLVWDVYSFCQWFTRYLTATTQRLLHIIYPQKNDWVFSLRKDNESQLLHCLTWGPIPSPMAEEVDECTLVLLIQPPWILSKQDIDSFAQCSYLPRVENQSAGHFESKYRLWAKTHDTCVRKECRWFILSNGQSFALGVFSEGYTKAFVATAPDSSSTEPNILECLFYWVASSMRVPGSFCVPEVPESFYQEAHPNAPPPAGPAHVVSRTSDGVSESSWGCKDDDVPSQAGSWASLSRASSRTSRRHRVFDYRRDEAAHFQKRPGRYYTIKKWVRDEQSPEPEPLPIIEEETSTIASSQWSMISLQNANIPEEFLHRFWILPSPQDRPT